MLERVFAADVLTCPCGGRGRVLCFITDTEVARQILTALGLSAAIPTFAPPADRGLRPARILRRHRALAGVVGAPLLQLLED
jgi:hypothetical protein